MSLNKNHFKDVKLRHTGEYTDIGTGLMMAGKGIFIVNIEDDDGRIHIREISNILHAPGLLMVLLNPQCWAQQAQDTVPHPMVMSMVNDYLSYILYWNKKLKKMVSFHEITNTPSFLSTPGCSHCHLLLPVAYHIPHEKNYHIAKHDMTSERTRLLVHN